MAHRFPILTVPLTTFVERRSTSADAHHGSLKAPILLRKDDEVGVYKIIENDHVIIIRNGERYDITGKKL